MNRIVVLLFTLAGLASAQAQGRLQFTVSLSGLNEAPPNNSLGIGSGTLSLTGNTLAYDFGGPFWSFPANATINGPADASSTAPVIFDLGAPIIALPNPPATGGYEFAGTINNFSSTEINDLLAGHWYVNVSSGAPDNGDIRGQIIPVPEPSTLALFGFGKGLLAWRFRKRKE